MMNSLYDTGFDPELKKRIPFFSLHESFLPYIGVNYRNAKLKILHVGNCHYIEQSQDPADSSDSGKRRYGFSFFRDNWFRKSIPVFPEISNPEAQMKECYCNDWKLRGLSCENAWNEYCLNTRSVISEFLTKKRNAWNLVGKSSGYAIFWAMVHALNEYPDKQLFGASADVPPKTREDRIAPYTYVAYTDFHFIPSLERGETKVENTLIRAALSEGIQESEAVAFYQTAAAESAKILDGIIRIIQPDLIYITGKAAEVYLEYTALGDEYKKRICCDVHPNYCRSKEQKAAFRNRIICKINEALSE